MNFIKEYAIYIVAWLLVGIVLMFQNNKKEVEDLQELSEKLKEGEKEW